ncbi:proline-rich receptor-like protein kinase PERK2 [Phoenix dactylifera]|uniref:Proline-rich receptor-like protein kinase PERK2 n=1 Tax=Phoenix dactylifera TaxID=42345 RepID=A0A8B8ZRQ4_PHODC|nr:proline-rich receptor-like protein kinase PERK2 [Phoenix dactylifera]
MSEIERAIKETKVTPAKTPADSAFGSPPENRPIHHRTQASSISASCFSSASPSLSPFAAHRFFPSSTIPFSWEHLPNVPKSPKSHSPTSSFAADPHILLLPCPRSDPNRTSSASTPSPSTSTLPASASSPPPALPMPPRTPSSTAISFVAVQD